MEFDTGWELVKEADEKFIIPVTKESRIQYFLDEAKIAAAKDDYYSCKSWLLTGVSVIPDSFDLQFELYLFEKKRKNLPEIAWHFESLYRKFPNQMENEVREISDAVSKLHMTTTMQSPEQIFLNSIFTSLPKSFQMEVLLSRSEKTNVQYEKCQTMLLLVKLFPDMVGQHGADLLFSLLGCESKVNSIFRKLLVTELIPAVLNVKKDWTSSEASQLYQILNQCIEYYVLIPLDDRTQSGVNAPEEDRWTILFNLVDQIGQLLRWRLTPLMSEYKGQNLAESMYQRITSSVKDKTSNAPNEIGYLTVVLFLYCIVSYGEIRHGSRQLGKDITSSGDRSKFAVVEVFIPRLNEPPKVDSKTPVLLTASHCSSVGVIETHQLISYFQVSSKLWEWITNSREGKEVFDVLYTMKFLDFDTWSVFQRFSLDYRTYVGQLFTPETTTSKNPIELASSHCANKNYHAAAENVLLAVSELFRTDEGEDMKLSIKSEKGDDSNEANNLHTEAKEDFGFFNPHLYAIDKDGSFVAQRRVHFLSDNPFEVVTYAANILIKCLFDVLQDCKTVDDLCLGHLLTLLQLEWPSPPAEMVFSKIIQLIKGRGSFRYSPYFGDYILEPDFLEQFMYFGRHEAKKVKLDIWNASPNSVIVSTSRRMATRGVDKGAKNDFIVSMKRQMLKNGQQSLEQLITSFMNNCKTQILGCLR